MSYLIGLVRSERKKSVLRVLQNATAPMSCDEIAAIVETSPAIVSECLRKLSTDDNLVHKAGKMKRSNRSIVALWAIGGELKKERIDKKELAALDEKTREAVKRGVSVLVIGGKKVYDRGIKA